MKVLERNLVTKTHKIRSSYKFCLLAEGAANLYLRFNQTSEWDTAAGQALCEASGYEVLSIGDGLPLKYGKQGLVNPGFVVKLIGTKFQWNPI